MPSHDVLAPQSPSQFYVCSLPPLFQPFPEWRVSPFFSVGSGKIKTFPSATLVETEDRDDNVMQASLGAYVHLTGRLFLRADYTNHYVLTSRNTNEEVNEWKLGFNVFF